MLADTKTSRRNFQSQLPSRATFKILAGRILEMPSQYESTPVTLRNVISFGKVRVLQRRQKIWLAFRLDPHNSAHMIDPSLLLRYQAAKKDDDDKRDRLA